MSSWPVENSGLAARLNVVDWAATSLGPIVDWPDRIKAVVDLVLASPLVASIALGPERRLIYNEVAARLYGDKHPAAFGSPLSAAFPDSYPTVAALYDRVFAGEAVHVAAQPLAINAQGEMFDAYLTPVRDAQGQVVGAHMVGLEVGRRVRAEAALREREADLIRVQRIGRVGGLDIDVARGLVGRRSPEFLRLHGLGPDSANETHADWRARVHPEDVDEAERRLFETLAGTALLYDSEYRIIRPSDGAIRWIHARADIERDDSGAATRIVGAHLDVTDQKHMQEALHVSEARQAFLLKLSDALRPLAAADAIADTACRTLVEHMGASKAQFTEVTGEAGSEMGECLAEYVAAGVPMPRRYPLAAFGEPLVAELRQGRSLILDDTARDGRLSPAEAEAFAAVDTPAAIAVPLVKGGRLVANLAIHDARPRAWTASDVAIVEDVAERTWAAIERARAEAAVRASEALLAAAFDSVPVGIAIIDRSGAAVRSNVQYKRFLPNGVIPSSDASSLPRWRGWDEHGRPLDAAQFPGARALRGDTVVPGQEMLYTDDTGREIWTAVATAPVRDRDGAIIRIVSTIADIDAAKRSDEALRASEERFRALVTAGTLSIYRMSPDWRLMYQLDSQTLADTAEPIEDWVDKYIPDTDLPNVRAAIATAIRTKSPFELEHRVWAADGGITWVMSRAVPLLGKDGEILEWFGAGTVVTERREAEEALRESEERYRALFESMDEAYAVVEVLKDEAGAWADFRFIAANPAFMVHTTMPYPVGRTATELLGRPNPRWTALYGEALDSGKPLRVEEVEETLGIIFDLNIFALDRAENRVAVLFTNITDRKQAETALRESEQRLRTLADTAPALIWFNDPAGGNTFANRVFLDYTGRSPEQIAGQGWQGVIDPDLQASYVAGYLEAVRARRPWHDRSRIRRADGAWHWFENYARPLFAPNGSYLGHVGVSVDVNEVVEAEKALSESEERQRLTIQLVPALLWSADPDGRDISLNEAWFAYTGQSVADTRNDGWLAAIHPDDLPATQADFAHAFATGEPLERRHRIHKAGNGYRWHLVRHVPVRDEAGNITRWFGAAVDIHDSTLAEQALDESERRLQTLIEGVPQLVWRASGSGVWTWASPQWTLFTGQPEAESHGWGWLAPVHPDDRARVRTIWDGAVAHGSFEADYRICHAAEDRYRWFQTRATPVRNAAGTVVEWLGTSTDVDDMRSLQERQSVLVAELQHRTFNLMGMVRSMADATIRASDSLTTFKTAFDERILALARVQRLLSRLQDDDRITFDELIHGELDAAGALPEQDSRVTLSGPVGVMLRSSTLQTFAMAVHELITNAVKYGALSQPEAALSITWDVEMEADTPWLHLDWVERGVVMPPESARSSGTGQGRRLIEGALPYQLRARTSFAMAADGVRCSIALPVSNRKQARPS